MDLYDLLPQGLKAEHHHQFKAPTANEGTVLTVL